VPETPSAPETTDSALPPPPPPSEGTGGPDVFGRENVDSRVTIRATSDSWVQVQTRANELLLTRILKAGDSYRVPNRDDVVLTTGNAGGLEILVDGVAQPSLGEFGAVRRDVPLGPSSFSAADTAD
jgi:cytoskeleton protein RodZ